MGAQQSQALSAFTAQGPWNSTHHLPSPWSLDPIPPLTLKVMKGVVGISSFSLSAMLAMFIYIRYFDTRGKAVLKWYALSYPVTTQSQMLILICHLLLAQVLQQLGYLLSAYHLAKDQVISPSAVCNAQGITIFVSHLLTHITIANIAIHSTYCIFSLKPMSLLWFWTLNGATWFLTISIAIVFPIIFDALQVTPFFTFGSIACFVSALWKVEKVSAVYVPCIFFLFLGLVLYPCISFKLAQHSGRLGRMGPRTEAVTRTEREVLRAAKRVLIFPFVIFVVTSPFLMLSMLGVVAPDFLKHNSWFVMLCGYLIAAAPLVSCIMYFFMTSFFRTSTESTTVATTDTDHVDDEFSPTDTTFPLGSGTVKTFISSPAAEVSPYYCNDNTLPEDKMLKVELIGTNRPRHLSK